MKKKDFRTCFKFPHLALRMGGIYLNYPNSMNWVQYIQWSWFYYMNTVSLILDVIGAMVWFVNGAREGKSFVELTFIAPCFICSTMALIKMFFLFKNKRILTEVTVKLHDMYPENIWQEEIKNILEDAKSLLSLIASVMFYLNFVLAWLFNLFPLVYTAHKYLTIGEFELILPYSISYPFNEFDIKIWPFIYLRQMWSGLLSSVVGVVGPDTLYYAYCTHIRMHFRIIQYELRQCVVQTYQRPLRSSSDRTEDDDWRVGRNKVDNAKLTNIYVKLVKKHQLLIDLVDCLNRLYSMSTLFNFFSSSVLICLTGFNVMAIDASKLPVFSVFLVSSLSQIFLFCLFGDMIEESSIEVGMGIYDSRWYLADTGVRKMMLISLTRAQRECKLTAFNYADVNLNSFSKILSTSWSYFALLQTMYNRN